MRISGLAAIALTLFSLSILIIGIYSTLTIAQRTGFDINIGLTILGVVIPSLVAIGTTLISLYKSGSKIKVRIHSQRAEGAGGTNTGSKIIFNNS